MTGHARSFSVKIGDQTCALLEHTHKHCTQVEVAVSKDGCFDLKTRGYKSKKHTRKVCELES